MKQPIRLAELIDSPVPLIILVEGQVLARRNEDDVDLSWTEDEVTFFSLARGSPAIVADVSYFFLETECLFNFSKKDPPDTLYFQRVFLFSDR